MKPKKSPPDAETQAQILAKLRRDVEIRQKGYRERALALFPHICASCGREFSGKRLKELTVHHKDHNHENNPPDGSNWELLCIYCHDHEHEKYKLKGYVDGSAPDEKPKGPSIANPFENLDNLLKGESTDQMPTSSPRRIGSPPFAIVQSSTVLTYVALLTPITRAMRMN